jgi:hypothetical protein
MGCSALTCDELGAAYGGDWRTTTNNFRRGSDQVCGESDGGFMAADGTNACFGGDLHGNGSGDLGGAQNDIITDGWSHAGSICLAIGARLCTTEELQADETRGTGCGHDGEWVWSSDTCADGHLVAVGGSNNGRNLCSGDGEECLPDQNPCTCNARCWASTENAGVRCCADVVGPLCNAEPAPADVTVMASSLDGMSTVQLTFSLSADQANVYAMAGTGVTTMTFPAAFQAAAPFGTDIGGVSPAFWAVNAESQFDSWLTLGVTDGSAGTAISASPGLGLDAWSTAAAFSSDNGAVFYMDPDSGPAGSDIVLAQITSETPTGTATAVLQGRSASGADWSEAKTWEW